MTETSIARKRKRDRLKINNVNEFKDALIREGYKINVYNDEMFKENVARVFELDKSILDRLHKCIEENEATYKADNIKDFILYIERIVLFEKEHKRLCEKISSINKINIDRVEYERETSVQDDVKHMLEAIEKVKINMSSNNISDIEKARLEQLEEEIDKDYLYAKDIELLKKMLITEKENIEESYNEKTKVKTVSIKVPKEIGYQYIKVKEGSIEYHKHLIKTIPRLQRLIKNINRYIKVDNYEKSTFNINQSSALQDSINIAVAEYNDKEFKAISGSNDIIGYCKAPVLEKAAFTSNKVNKLGKLGIGYNRVNDSEKKIFEEINRQIEDGLLKDEGNLILYSKWEPCPSCYFVISQFCEKYPKITVQIKYSKKYGE